MAWDKKGLIFQTHPTYDWMQSHASNPVADHIEGDLFRIYFNSRDSQNRAFINYIDINIYEPQKVVNQATEPVLLLGEKGTFDDSGMSMGWVLRVGEKRFLYYLGWNLAVNVPFRNAIGLAIQETPQAPFQKVSAGPILDRDMTDPLSLSYPCVLEKDGHFHMWYGSHLKWGDTRHDMTHVFKYAESTDGIHWSRTGHICLDATARDYAFSKPCVIYQDRQYHMWYSYRGGKYRIGYATSQNGTDWQRKDETVGIDVSPEGWDSEMICYPNVFLHKGKQYMVYNGNQYGKTGIGMAVWE